MSSTYVRFLQTVVSAAVLFASASPAFSQEPTEALFQGGTQPEKGLLEEGVLSKENFEISSAEIETTDSSPIETSYEALETLATDNCNKIARDTIILSGSTAIFAQPLKTIQFNDENSTRPVRLQLSEPLSLTDNCVLEPSVGEPVFIEGQLEKTRDEKGVIIKLQSIVVSGHHLSLPAQSREIPFERIPRQKDSSGFNGLFCEGISTITTEIPMGSDADPAMKAGVQTSVNALCQTILQKPSHTWQAEINEDDIYSFRLEGVQAIPVPPALRDYSTEE